MITISHHDGINRTPALELALRGLVECLERGLSDGALGLNWDQQAILASADPDTHVGVIVWEHVKWRKEVFVHQSYVLPSWRKRGIYTLMWGELVGKAKGLGVSRIVSGIHADNATMIAAAVKHGRTCEGVFYALRVDEEGA